MQNQTVSERFLFAVSTVHDIIVLFVTAVADRLNLNNSNIF